MSKTIDEQIVAGIAGKENAEMLAGLPKDRPASANRLREIALHVNAESSARLRALANVLDMLTPERVRLLDRYTDMACTCGVITSDDAKDWDAACRELPVLLTALRQVAST